MQRGSFLVSEVVRYSPHSIVPSEDRIVENWWNLEKQFSHIFQKLERDLETQHQNWQTDGNLACGWERVTSQTSTLSERTMESCMREVYDDSQKTAGQKRNLKAVVETPQKPRSMTTDDALDPRVVPEAHEQENPNEEANENNEESGETPDKPEDMDHEMEGETLPEPDHSSDIELKPKRETHRNTRERVREKDG